MEWGGGKADIVGIRREKITFSGWRRRFCLSGHQAHTAPFPKPGKPQGSPDAFFTAPLPLSSPKYAEPDDCPRSCLSSSCGSLPSHRWKEIRGGLHFNKEGRRAFSLLNLEHMPSDCEELSQVQSDFHQW